MIQLAGLPRSGSSLILAVLSQNPTFQVGVTSGLPELINLIKNNWDATHQNIPFDSTKGFNDDDISQIKKRATLNGLIDGYLSTPLDKISIDKSRAWPELVELLQWLGRTPKILVPVRDLRGILASFERLYRENPNIVLPHIQAKPLECKTLAGRCEVLSHATGVVGYAYNAIQDMTRRVDPKVYHFIDYDNFTAQPEKTLKQVYKFLELPYFEHDFNNVVSVPENDHVHGFPTIHAVRPKIAPQPPNWPTYLGELANKYVGVTESLTAT